MMVLFSYEADVLEIMLHESIDLVDKIVIVESSVSHRGVSSDILFSRVKCRDFIPHMRHGMLSVVW